jgi:hypothetical protein
LPTDVCVQRVQFLLGIQIWFRADQFPHFFTICCKTTTTTTDKVTTISSVSGARPCFESVLRAREIERERERNSNREKVNLNPISLLQARFNTSLRLLRSLSRVLVVVLRDDCCSIVVSRDEKLFLRGIKFMSERGTKRYVCVRVCAKNVCPSTQEWRKAPHTMTGVV